MEAPINGRTCGSLFPAYAFPHVPLARVFPLGANPYPRRSPRPPFQPLKSIAAIFCLAYYGRCISRFHARVVYMHFFSFGIYFINASIDRFLLILKRLTLFFFYKEIVLLYKLISFVDYYKILWYNYKIGL